MALLTNPIKVAVAKLVVPNHVKNLNSDRVRMTTSQEDAEECVSHIHSPFAWNCDVNMYRGRLALAGCKLI